MVWLWCGLVLRAERYARVVCSLLVLCVFLGGHQLRASAAQGVVLVPAGWPKVVSIPRIGVQTPLEDISFQKLSDYAAPYKWNDAGWFSRGVRPGDLGRAFIFGHLDSTCCPAVFWRLADLHPGDVVRVGYRNGRSLAFRVMWQKVYWNRDIPLKWMFGPARQRGLILFTCAGIFHHDGSGYDRKLVVYSRLVLPGGQLG